jgi:hypothetical protein
VAGDLAAESGRTAPLDVCFTPFSHPHFRDRMDPDVFVDEARALADIGVTWLALHLPSPTKSDLLDNIASFGRDAVAKVKGF